MTPPDPAAPLLAAVRGLDLSSADGRAGIRCLLAEIERLSPVPSNNRPPPSSSAASAARRRQARGEP